MADEFKVGAEIEVGHPFVRDTYTEHFGDGEGSWSSVEKKTWKPGCRTEMIPPDDCEAVADAMGSQILTVVSVHKPGRFPERIFYTRRWRDPDGKEFGKSNLRMKTTPAFRRLTNGYRVEFRLADKAISHTTGVSKDG